MANPIIMVTCYFAATHYFSLSDFAHPTTSIQYRGTLQKAPVIKTAKSDVWYGTQPPQNVTLQFSNTDDGVNPTWDDIIAAGNIREKEVDIYVFEVTEGTNFIAKGFVTGWELGSTTSIRIEIRRKPLFDKSIPELITTDEFGETALDVGKAKSIPFGNCEVPLRNIRTDDENSEYDYLIGHGTIQGIRNNESLGLGVKRWNSLGNKNEAGHGRWVSPRAYTFFDGSQTGTGDHPGYAFIRFIKSQTDTGGNPYTITADVTGIKHGAGYSNDGGTYYGVHCDNNYIYTACYDDGLKVYTYDGGTFDLKAEIDNGDNYKAVWSDNTYIYCACWGSGLRVYTFDGVSLTLVTSIDNGSFYNGVWGDGTYIYCACWGDGVRAYSFNGTTLTLLDTKKDGSHVYNKVWGDGTYIYCATLSGLKAYTFSGTTFSSLLDTTTAISDDVWGDGTYIYEACGGLDDGPVRVFTFNGSSFTLITSYIPSNFESCNSVYGDGTYLYAIFQDIGIKIFTFDGNDISLVMTRYDNTHAYGIHGDGTYLYVAYRDNGIWAYNKTSDTLTTADNNAIVTLKNFLINTTWGLSQTVDDDSFDQAIEDLPLESFMCDGAITEQQKVGDILRDLMYVARASLTLNSSGEWEISINKTGLTSVASFGYGDGYLENILEEPVATVPDSSNTLKKSIVHYAINQAGNPAYINEVDVFSSFGQEKVDILPFVREHATAKKHLSYMKYKSEIGDDRLKLKANWSARDVVVGNLITVTIPDRGITDQDYYVEETHTNGMDEFTLVCSAWSSGIFADATISDPTSWGVPPEVSLGPETFFPTPSEEHLVAHFDFNSLQGTVAINSVDDTNHGTLTGTWTDAAWVPFVSNGGLEFSGVSGSNQRVEIDNPLLGATNFFISAWVQKDSFVADRVIFSDWDSGGYKNIQFCMEETEDAITCRVGDGSSYDELIFPDVFNDVGPLHIGLRFQGASGPSSNDGVMEIWCSLGKITKTDCSIQAVGNTQSIYCQIGRYMTTTWFDGTMDALRFYDTGLGDELVSSLYYNPVADGTHIMSGDSIDHGKITNLEGLGVGTVPSTTYPVDLVGNTIIRGKTYLGEDAGGDSVYIAAFNSTTTGAILRLLGAGSYADWRVDNISGSLRMFCNDASNKYLYVSNSGAGGMGLVMTGLRGAAQGANPTVFQDSASGEIKYDTSAKRYKENVKPVNNIDWIYNIPVVTFDEKDGNKRKGLMGCIAEDIEKINPGLVYYKPKQKEIEVDSTDIDEKTGKPKRVKEWVPDLDNQELEGVAYHELIPALLKAVQDQKIEIDRLKPRLGNAPGREDKVK